jgi:hypothetical protein
LRWAFFSATKSHFIFSGLLRRFIGLKYLSRWRKVAFLRLPASRLRSASKRRLGAATTVSCVAANFPPNFGKTTISLAFPQILRENQVQTKVNELQPFVCLLLIFYFSIE